MFSILFIFLSALHPLVHAGSPGDSSTDILSIQNTLNLYPLAVDSKNFTALSSVFAPDAIANYSAPLGVLVGLPSIESAIGKGLLPVTTQHALSTMVVTLTGEGLANTTTYFTATHFGHGTYEGQILTAYGRYEDMLALSGAGWRIQFRHLIYMGPLIGNLLIFENTNATVGSM